MRDKVSTMSPNMCQLTPRSEHGARGWPRFDRRSHSGQRRSLYQTTPNVLVLGMNQHTQITAGPVATRRFTTSEFEAMAAGGIFRPDERLVLVAGKIIVMSRAGRFHEVLRCRPVS